MAKNNSALATVDVDLLAQLAEEFGISLEPEKSDTGSSSGKIWTNFTSIDGIRVVKSGWMDDAASFTWNAPGETEFLEDFEEQGMLGITQLTGFIVHVELQTSLNKKYDPDATTSGTICSTAGYYDSGKEQLVKGLPGYTPINSMYEWDKNSNRPDYTKPKPVVEQLGLVGSKGMRCVDCIHAGESHMSTGFDDNGREQIQECSAKGRLFMYVTSVSRTKRAKPRTTGGAPEIITTTKTIRELLNVSGILVQLNLPAKSGLKGHYKADGPVEENIVGYNSYLMQLKIASNNKLSSPLMYETTISVVRPPASSKNPKNFLNFSGTQLFERELFRDARKAWNEAKPMEEAEILNPQRFLQASDSQAIPVQAAAVSTPTPELKLKSAAIVDDGEDGIPF